MCRSILGLLEQAAVAIPVEQKVRSTKSAAKHWSLSWALTLGVAILLVAVPIWWLSNRNPAPLPISPDGEIVRNGTDKDEVTFLVEPAENVPQGNFDPNVLSLLMPKADVILYGKVVKVGPKRVKFRVKETLRGDLKNDKVDSSRGPDVGCVPAVIVWPEGKDCLIFLRRDPSTKVVRPVLYGAGVQPLPYLGMIDIAGIREIVRVWELEFAGLDYEEAETHAKTVDQHKRLIYNIVRRQYYRDEFQANVKLLNEWVKKNSTDEDDKTGTED